MDLAKLLNPEKALIFRITHVANVPWTLKHGLFAKSSGIVDPGFVTIGNQELIDKRATRPVLVPDGGCLSEYVPFYFTPFSPMLFNIFTGRGGVEQRRNEEIAILVSSLHRFAELGVRFVISDRHAYLAAAQFSEDVSALRNWLPWHALHTRNFRRDPDRPQDFDHYQAEALARRHVPPNGILGVVCYTEGVASTIEDECMRCRLDLKVLARPDWYFT